MRTDRQTGLTLVTAALLAVWLSAAAVNARPTIEPLAPDAHAGHTAMIEQMRRDVDPGMVERMNEPAWREMRRPGMLAEMEAHQRTIDRMLGRTLP
jgi:hypothetical protein